jgi:integrative and conjugative element protein (TIGR02256 family)
LDTAHLQTEADRWFRETDGDISYIGDWHLHHQRDPVPSRRDRRTIQEVAGRPEIGLARPLIVIVGKRRGDLRWRAWVGPELLSAQIEFVTKR